MKPTDRQAIGIIVSLALIVAYLYFDRIDRPNYEARSALHAEILAGTAPALCRHRRGNPFLMPTTLPTPLEPRAAPR